MNEQFKKIGIGVKDGHGEEIKEGDKIRWSGEDGSYQGVVEFRENDDETSPFLSGFACKDITETNDEISDKWDGSLEIVRTPIEQARHDRKKVIEARLKANREARINREVQK